jgi:lipoate-protein ligase A
VARRIHLLRGELSGGGALDTALARGLLEDVARGERPETLRLWRPADALAFSVTDRTRPGFAAAALAAQAAGFEPFLRLAGGHAAVYTRQTLAFAWTIPAPHVHEGIQERFGELAGLVAASLRRLGVDARVGEVPGEYCPGGYSVNARGRVKLMGVGQRVTRGAAHVGGVVVVSAAERVRRVLGPVYAALGLAFDPAAVGSVEDEAQGAGEGAVAEALLAEFAARFELVDADLTADLVERARQLEPAQRAEVAFAPSSARASRS